MVTVVTRQANGIPLTHQQVDDNFTGLADAVNSVGADVIAEAVAAKNTAVTASNAAQSSANSAANSANAASISRGNAATSAESAATSAANAAASAAATASAFQTFKTTLASYLGGTLVGWIQNGADAILQTVSAKLLQQYVTPFDFGGRGDLSGFDDTGAVEKAISCAIARNKPLDMSGGNWVITRNLDATGVSDIYWSNNSALVDRRPAGAGGFLFSYGKATGNPHTGRAQGTWHGIMVAYREALNIEADGVYLKGGLCNFGHIRAYGYKGHGIYGNDLWDSTIERFSVELCGTPSKKGLWIDSDDGDTSNCLQIGAIQCEQARDGGVHVVVTRSKIGPIHSERLYISTLNDGSTPNILGKTYTNHYFSLSNCQTSQAIFDAAPAGTEIPGADGATSISADLQLRVFLDSSQINSFEVAGDITQTGGSNSTYTVANCANFQAIAPVNNTIANLMRVSAGCRVEQNFVFNNPDIYRFLPTFNANNITTYGGIVRDPLVYINNILGGITFNDTTFVRVGDTLATPDGRRGTVFNNCTMGDYVGGFNCRAEVNGGYIFNINLVSQSAAIFNNVRASKFDYNGNDGHITINCHFDEVVKWAVPGNVNWPMGTRTERPNFVASTGARYVNKNSGITWGVETTFPA